MTEQEWKKLQKHNCKKKKRFTSKAEADTILARAWRISRWDLERGLRPIASYKCPVCKNWHLTTKPQKEKNLWT